jgi:hypothetical protein
MISVSPREFCTRLGVGVLAAYILMLHCSAERSTRINEVLCSRRCHAEYSFTALAPGENDFDRQRTLDTAPDCVRQVGGQHRSSERLNGPQEYKVSIGLMIRNSIGG